MISVRITPTIERVTTKDKTLYTKESSASIGSSDFSPSELRAIANDIELCSMGAHIRDTHLQSEYRCCLLSGMTHEAALAYMRRIRPDFVPQVV